MRLLVIALAVIVGCGKRDPDLRAENEVLRAELEAERKASKLRRDPDLRAENEALRAELDAERKASKLRRDPDPVVGPTEAQIKKDLVGQIFWYEYGMRGPAAGGRQWTIKAAPGMQPGEISNAVIIDRVTDSKAGTEEVEVSLILARELPLASAHELESMRPWVIRGVLVMAYKRFDQGWRLQSVWSKAGGRPRGPGDPGEKPFSWEILDRK
jgi:hypothetical protein